MSLFIVINSIAEAKKKKKKKKKMSKSDNRHNAQTVGNILVIFDILEILKRPIVKCQISVYIDSPRQNCENIKLLEIFDNFWLTSSYN